MHHRPIPHTRRSLGALLRQPPLAPLAAGLGTPDLRLPAGLRAAVTQSAVRLAEAWYVRTPAAQLLGAVTAIEILVSDPIETYDQMRRRLGALLGWEALDRYAVEGVLRARHRYVHQGDPAPARAVVPPAIGLALAALLRYAAAAPVFPDKGAILDYLDWTASGARLARTWTAADQRAGATIQAHTCSARLPVPRRTRY